MLSPFNQFHLVKFCSENIYNDLKKKKLLEFSHQITPDKARKQKDTDKANNQKTKLKTIKMTSEVTARPGNVI